jgi:hypothetical protein
MTWIWSGGMIQVWFWMWVWYGLWTEPLSQGSRWVGLEKGNRNNHEIGFLEEFNGSDMILTWFWFAFDAILRRFWGDLDVILIRFWYCFKTFSKKANKATKTQKTHFWPISKSSQNQNCRARPQTNQNNQSDMNHIKAWIQWKLLFWTPSILEPADVITLAGSRCSGEFSRANVLVKQYRMREWRVHENSI